jgi:hypothetical protein
MLYDVTSCKIVKHVQEIEGLLWKINPDCLQSSRQRNEGVGTLDVSTWEEGSVAEPVRFLTGSGSDHSTQTKSDLDPT